MKTKFLLIVAGTLLISSCASKPEAKTQEENIEPVVESQIEVAPAKLRISMNVDKNDKTVSRPVMITASGMPIIVEIASDDKDGVALPSLFVELVPTLEGESVHLVGVSKLTTQDNAQEPQSVDLTIALDQTQTYVIPTTSTEEGLTYTLHITPTLEEQVQKP